MANGPEVKLEMSCRGCEHLRSECEYDEQGDRSWRHACGHPDMLADLGYNTRTPPACPLRAAAIAAKVKTLGFVSIDSIKGVLPAKADMDAVVTRERAATPGPWASDYQPAGPCVAKCYRDQIIAPDADRWTVAIRPNPAFNGPGRAARIQEMADGAFIGHSRRDIPWLLRVMANIRRVLGEND